MWELQTIQLFSLLRLQHVCMRVYTYMNKKLESFQQKKKKVVCYIIQGLVHYGFSSQIQPTISFYKQTFIKTLPRLLVLVLSVTASTLWQQNWIVVTDYYWSAKSKTVVFRPSQKKSANPNLIYIGKTAFRIILSLTLCNSVYYFIMRTLDLISAKSHIKMNLKNYSSKTLLLILPLKPNKSSISQLWDQTCCVNNFDSDSLLITRTKPMSQFCL